MLTINPKMSSNIYIIVKTIACWANKPSAYTLTEIRPINLPATVEERPSIFSYCSGIVEHNTANLRETYIVKLQWHLDPRIHADIVGFANERAALEEKMNELAKPLVAKNVERRFGEDRELKGIKLTRGNGETIWFEVLEVAVLPQQVY